ncbi:hypothetical protein DVA86_20455 [Streptomyces armeniacus]|uniref:Lsr2 DNA-binding domain-containing protein n=1 Tax=Streptomyces armeniacus TaxID=83291 RepID=A0A345XSQ1_9ACTN|nr:histone-like nucleoid-structuring protein Lsr2 [Streptomyces armeniacus]AXK34667.1 hypothetical protein DVA86_20455 [Streptomyces armeniacus]
MFADWQQALEAESLPLDPSPDQQLAAAARVTARHAHGKADLTLLLDNLGLPTDDDTLTTLFPLLNQTGEPRMTTPNAIEAVALSMYNDDTPAAQITEATGLTEDQITALADAQDHQTAADAVPAASDVEQLLAWAEDHTTAVIRNKAARIRRELAGLAERRDTENAQRKAEERVAKLQAELEKAQQKLRAVKTGGRPATTAAAPVAAAKRSKEQQDEIRAWGRANGYQVAAHGKIPKNVVEAYEAAQQPPTAAAS